MLSAQERTEFQGTQPPTNQAREGSVLEVGQRMCFYLNSEDYRKKNIMKNVFFFLLCMLICPHSLELTIDISLVTCLVFSHS